MNTQERKKTIANDFLALLILALGILTIISIASFNIQDSSYFTNPPVRPAKNLIGVAGALWSSILLLGLGKSAYLIGLILILSGWSLLIKKEKILYLFNLSGLIFIMLTFSIIMSIKLANPRYLVLIKKGGIIGFFLKELLQKYLGLAGIYIISASLIILSLMLLTNFSLKSIANFLQDIIKGLKKIIWFFKNLFTLEIKHIEDHKPPLISKEQKQEYEEEAVPEITENLTTEIKQEEPRIVKPEKKLLEESKKGMSTRYYTFPPQELLTLSPHIDAEQEKHNIQKNAEKLEQTLKEFDVEAKVINIHKGPVITRYELQPASGIKISKIVSLADNIALSLAAQRVRIVAPIPGKAAVGVEIPNAKRNMVTLGDILNSRQFKKKYELIEIALGKDISGNPVKINLIDCPHLLIAGATGSGKSVLLNSIICGLLYNVKPENIRFVIIDPKMVELKIYNGIPHLMTEVITNSKHAIVFLKYLVKEMDKRYEMLDEIGARDIQKLNERIKKGRANELKPLPYIIVIIDEFADLMMVTTREIEDLIVRLAQKARAVGIHLIIATQRPSVDVITGLIKANFPTRIAFQVASKIDSRTILDANGAEKLLGKGDMLLSLGNRPGLQRIQGAFISEDEVEKIIQTIENNNFKLDYLDINDLIQQIEQRDLEQEQEEEWDELYFQAREVVKQTKKASASFLQRRLKIGFNRAARYIDMMENEGIIGPPAGSKPRDVYIDRF